MDDESELQKTVRRITLGDMSSKRVLDQMTGMTALARHAAILESPAMRIMRDLQNSPVMRLQRDLENSPIFRMQKELETLNRASVAFAPENNIFRQLEQFKKQHALYGDEIDLARRMLPPPSLLQDAARQVAAIVDPPNTQILAGLAWSKRIESVMAGMSRPWVSVENSALSLQGLGVLTRVSDTARLARPYMPETRELFDSALGEAVEIDPGVDEEEADAAHLDAGMDAGLVTLSPPETGEILRLSGFELIVPYAPLPLPVNDDAKALHYDASYADFVTQIERRLRTHIDTLMSDSFGSNWIKARVASDVQNKWRDRQAKAVESGELKFSLIHYSDFIELKMIMTGRKTWDPLFAKQFGIKEHFITAMDRLYAVRKPLAHGRPISNGQRLHLYIEGVALMRALGVKILSD